MVSEYTSTAERLCVETLTANAHSEGYRIDLEWEYATVTDPSLGGFVLVRKQFEYPANATDGLTVVTVTKAGEVFPTTYTDSGLSADIPYYYNMFSYDEGGSYVKYYYLPRTRVNETATSSWGHSDFMYDKLLPRVYRIEDANIGV